MTSEVTIVRAQPAPHAIEWTAEQRQMIRDTFANGASDDEFAVLMETARQWGLDPFKKQIYFVKRFDRAKNREVWSVQVAIDGMRARAERTGLYDGQDEPEFVENDKGGILLCKVRVYRKGWSRPAVGVAYFAEYVQGGPFWAGKPHIMIAKCAEALALRKAFPEELAGGYTPEEMGEDGAGPRTRAPRRPSELLPPDAQVPQVVADDIAAYEGALTIAQAVAIYLDHEPGLSIEDKHVAFDAAHKAIDPRVSKAAFDAAVIAERDRRAAPVRRLEPATDVPAEPAAPAPTPADPVAAIRDDLARELGWRAGDEDGVPVALDDAAGLWLRHKGKLTRRNYKTAWALLEQASNAQAGELKRAVAAREAARPAPANDATARARAEDLAPTVAEEGAA